MERRVEEKTFNSHICSGKKKKKSVKVLLKQFYFLPWPTLLLLVLGFVALVLLDIGLDSSCKPVAK